jgi:hypothetical protein
MAVGCPTHPEYFHAFLSNAESDDHRYLHTNTIISDVLSFRSIFLFFDWLHEAVLMARLRALIMGVHSIRWASPLHCQSLAHPQLYYT